MSAIATPIEESSPRYAGWRVVLACYIVAVFCWGFGLYGHGVYLTELHRAHGWPASLISGAVTGFYLLTAALVVFISDAIARLGPRTVMLIGTCCFCCAVALLAFINTLWQLYAIYTVMAIGAATMHVGAISNVVGLWFDRQRPLAISLALNGASSGGILVTPILVLAIERYGFTEALVGSAAIMALVMLPGITLWVRRPHNPAIARPAAIQAASWTRRRALRSAAFWSVAAPFAMALSAQVGFLVHQIAALEPVMGRTQAALSVAALTVCAILGRFGLGGFAKHLDMRRFAAWAIASQAVALIALTVTTNSAALMAACMVFGLSAGNLLSLPTLVIQHEFEAASFGMLVGLAWAISQFTYAFGPGVMGVIRDMTGAYTAPILLCAALDVAAAATILLSRPRSI